MAGQWRGAQVLTDLEGAYTNVATSIPGLNSQTVPGDQLPGGWHPTVAYMLAFVVGELFVFHFLSRHLNIL